MPGRLNADMRSCSRSGSSTSQSSTCRRRFPYCALQQLFDPFFRKGEFLHYWKAIYLDRLTDDVIEAIVGGCAVETLSTVPACHLGARRRDGPRRQRRDAGRKPARALPSRNHRELDRSRRTPSRTSSGCVTSSKRCTGSRRARSTRTSQEPARTTSGSFVRPMAITTSVLPASSTRTTRRTCFG